MNSDGFIRKDVHRICDKIEDIMSPKGLILEVSLKLRMCKKRAQNR